MFLYVPLRLFGLDFDDTIVIVLYVYLWPIFTADRNKIWPRLRVGWWKNVAACCCWSPILSAYLALFNSFRHQRIQGIYTYGSATGVQGSIYACNWCHHTTMVFANCAAAVCDACSVLIDGDASSSLASLRSVICRNFVLLCCIENSADSSSTERTYANSSRVEQT